MTITNLKPQNTTYVNDTEIASKRITASCTVQLGKDKYPVNLPMIIETAKQIADKGTSAPKEEISVAKAAAQKADVMLFLSSRDNEFSIERPKDEKTLTDLPSINYTIGRIAIVATDESFQLKPGKNIIGRKGDKSEADIQIDTDEKRMSREHILIEVKKDSAKGFVHQLSLFKEKVNKAFIEGDQLYYGDCIILNHGNVIKLPGALLKFEIPDNDSTEF